MWNINESQIVIPNNSTSANHNNTIDVDHRSISSFTNRYSNDSSNGKSQPSQFLHTLQTLLYLNLNPDNLEVEPKIASLTNFSLIQIEIEIEEILLNIGNLLQ